MTKVRVEVKVYIGWVAQESGGAGGKVSENETREGGLRRSARAAVEASANMGEDEGESERRLSGLGTMPRWKALFGERLAGCRKVRRRRGKAKRRLELLFGLTLFLQESGARGSGRGGGAEEGSQLSHAKRNAASDASQMLWSSVAFGVTGARRTRSSSSKHAQPLWTCAVQERKRELVDGRQSRQMSKCGQVQRSTARDSTRLSRKNKARSLPRAVSSV